MKRAHVQIQRKLALPGGAGRRQAWRKLADAARMESRRASGASYTPDPRSAADGAIRGLDTLDHLRILRRECTAGEFPIEGASCALLAECFLKAVDAFAGPAVASDRRCAWASLVRAAADAVMDLLEEQTGAEGARSWQSRMERD